MIKKHLVIDSRMIQHSGIGVYLKNTIPYLNNVFVITLIGNYHLLQKLGFTVDKGYKVIDANIKIYSLKEQWNLPLLIPKCDIFWSPHFNIPLLPIKATHKFLTICDAFHWANYDTLSLLQKMYTNTVGYFIKRNWASKTFTISEFSKAEIIKYIGIPKERIEIVYCAVDSQFNGNYVRKNIQDKYLLFVGNVKPHKNLLNALIAFNSIKDKYPDYKFYIVGKKDGFITGQFDELSKYIEDLAERVYFTGYVDDKDLKNYYSNASLFIFPSKYEGFGLPPLEAMTFNIPVVCSNAASLPEVCGDAVLYFNPNNYVDIADKIMQVIDHKWKPDLNKYKAQLSKFNWEDVAQMHIDCFNEVK